MNKLNSKEMWLKRKKYEKYLIHNNEADIPGFNILHNNIRNEILKMIGNKNRTIEDIKNFINIDISQLKFHLYLLEQNLFIRKENIGWRLTSKGNDFLQNTEV